MLFVKLFGDRVVACRSRDKDVAFRAHLMACEYQSLDTLTVAEQSEDLGQQFQSVDSIFCAA